VNVHFIKHDAQRKSQGKPLPIDRVSGTKCSKNQLRMQRSLNGRFRAECPNQHGFLILADAMEKLETWLLSRLE